MLIKFINWITYDLLSLAPTSNLGKSLNFFLYDSVKIIFLLFAMIFIIGILRSYIPQEKIKDWIKEKGILGNFAAALFGALTPFCSCSSIPIFFSFLEAGIPLGVSLSFLITSPLINEYLAILMFGFFGLKITLLYILSGLLIGTFSGLILGKMNLNQYLAQDLIGREKNLTEVLYQNFYARLKFGFKNALAVVKSIWIFVIMGVGLGALIHNYVPQSFINSIMKTTGIFSVPLATIIGVPMYGNCAAIVPIALALFQKGIPLGTALSLMMAIAALSLPEAVILKRAMKLRLIIIFFSITAIGIIITGYLFNLIPLMK